MFPDPRRHSGILENEYADETVRFGSFIDYTMTLKPIITLSAFSERRWRRSVLKITVRGGDPYTECLQAKEASFFFIEDEG